MADEVAVTLRAYDEITAPANSAAAALKNLSGAARQVGTDGASLAEGAAQATGALNVLEGTASHRFSHVGMNIIVGQAAQLVGASSGASAGLRLIETGLFAVGSAAGLMSGGMVLVIAAIAGVAAAFMSSSKAAEEQQKSIDALNKELQTFYETQQKVSAAGREAAALMANDQANAVKTLQNKLIDLNAQLKDLQTTSQVHDFLQGITSSIPGVSRLSAAFEYLSDKATNGQKAIREELVRTTAQIEMMQSQMKKTGDLAKGQSDAQIKAIQDADKAAAESLKKQDSLRLAQVAKEKDTTTMLQALFGNREQIRIASLNKELAAVKNFSSQDAQVMQQAAQKEIQIEAQLAQAKNTMMQTQAKTVETNIGDMIKSGQTMVDQNGKQNVALQALSIAFIMMQQAKAVAATLAWAAEEGGWVGFIAAAASIGAIIAMFASLISQVGGANKGTSAGSTAAGSVAAATTTAASGTTTPASGVATASPAGTGGTTQIINMPVQALDLASISDTQLKNLATRIGQALRDASASGQFSLT